jgi:hypothetical protein
VNWEQVEAGEGGDEKGRVGEGNSEGVNMDEGSLGLLRRQMGWDEAGGEGGEEAPMAEEGREAAGGLEREDSARQPSPSTHLSKACRLVSKGTTASSVPWMKRAEQGRGTGQTGGAPKPAMDTRPRIRPSPPLRQAR